MRSVRRGPCPPNLSGAQSSGHRERTAAIAHYSAANTVQENFNFREYKDQSVKEQLTVDYRDKCAYCESFVMHVTYGDIDHFRPKNAYQDSTGAEISPGYYWLASGWDNLFLSCELCNRPSWQTIAGGEKMLVGKGTRFPLLDESKRASGPGTETNEEPLLLNPDQVDVEHHLEFREDGVVVPLTVGSLESVRGRESIDIYGLQRLHLVMQRANHLRGVQGTVERYLREQQAYLDNPAGCYALERLQEAMKEVREYLCCRQQYLAMTRQYIAKKCPELFPLRECSNTSCIGASLWQA